MGVAEACEFDRGVVSCTKEGFRRQVAFLMHPTRVAQVKAVADAGEFMPQKSTFFYPKIASGAVINRVLPDEIL